MEVFSGEYAIMVLENLLVDFFYIQIFCILSMWTSSFSLITFFEFVHISKSVNNLCIFSAKANESYGLPFYCTLFGLPICFSNWSIGRTTHAIRRHAVPAAISGRWDCRSPSDSAVLLPAPREADGYIYSCRLTRDDFADHPDLGAAECPAHGSHHAPWHGYFGPDTLQTVIRKN